MLMTNRLLTMPRPAETKRGRNLKRESGGAAGSE
jgi:hypothetical protein